MTIIIALSLAPALLAEKPTAEEIARARAWAAEHFRPLKAEEARAEPPAPPRPGLHIIANYGPVQVNTRDGNRLRIADRTFERGLYCHAQSKILVRLPRAGKSFSALVGGETNGNYTGGTVRFEVAAGGRTLFRSGVLRRGDPGADVKVDLAGALEFFLVVSDGGDNINSDQACWGDPTVTLADGTALSLGDLPVLESSGRDRAGDRPPFSFVYGDRRSDELLGRWKFREEKAAPEGGRARTTQTYTDPESGLEVTCSIVEYTSYPTVEWTLRFKNTSATDAPILSEIQALDTRLPREPSGEFLLHHFVGSPCAPNDYQPLEAPLPPGARKRVTTAGGRPTNSDLPYFNIETGAGGGAIAVLGWSGQWAADFLRDRPEGLRIAAGQESARFRLHPGEEVRAPLAVLQFYRGDWIRAQNVWRAWMVEHNIPKLDGKPIRPIASACNGNHYPGIITNAAEELHFLRRYVEEQVVPDFWWEDAGWYRCGDAPNWVVTGTWEVDPRRWPKGIREVSDWCRERGIRTIVWFEPERVHAGTWLAENRPEWVLGGKAGGLLNLGIPECRKWITDKIDGVLVQEGIDLYRQDFNIDPLASWRKNDAEDREGITEIRHVEGYLAFWDELRRRHPGMLIDSCSSGGRRNDLETLRRAVPLLRSDYIFEPVGEQCHTYGVSFWMPFNGTGFLTIDPYLIRSQMSPEFTLGIDTRKKDQDYGLLRKLFAEWKRVSPAYLGDYWPLTPYSLADDVWIAWQFDRPDLGEGFFQAFRRAKCSGESVTLRLRGLDPEAGYEVVDLDDPRPSTLTGRDLMKGYTVRAGKPPAALIFAYRKTSGPGK